MSPCRRCGSAWCGDCLVYAFGGKKLPYCMSCAMFAGGIRTIAARPALPKREVKKLQKASKAEAKLAATQPAPEPAEADDAAVLADGVTPVGTDWEKPWWEDRQPTFAD
ncbi:MAG: hypothetical protein ACT452_01535 [Microthrixaceae bacterium]